MDIPHDVESALDAEKAEIVFGEVNRMYDFIMASRAILQAELQVTLQWLFALTIGPAGFLVHLAERPDVAEMRWLTMPLLLATLAGAAFSWLLLRQARAVSVVPPGNSPKYLLVGDVMRLNAELMKANLAASMQERIDEALGANRTTGARLNLCRCAVALIPAVCVVLMMVLYFTIG